MENDLEGVSESFKDFFMKLMQSGLGYRILPVTGIHWHTRAVSR